MPHTPLALTDGHPTTFGFIDNDITMGIVLWEKRVKPFGMDGGGPNDVTTMRSERWRKRKPKKLLTLTEMSITVAYDPIVFDPAEIVNFLQDNQELFLGWSDFSTVTFWGWVDGFEPHEITEGSQPEADLKICPSNEDNEGNEVGPVYFEPILG